jgi:hypothetical protein
LTFLLWCDNLTSPSAQTTRRRRWKAPQLAPPHDSRARVGASSSLHPSVREIWSLATTPSLYAREIERPLPTGALDRRRRGRAAC